MEGISNILKNKQITVQKSTRPINKNYETCKVIADYTGLQVFYVMRLSKKYGIQKVDRLRTFLKDYPNLDKKRAPGLAIWFLKNK